jgi:hypothetical protein
MTYFGFKESMDELSVSVGDFKRRESGRRVSTVEDSVSGPACKEHA